MAIIHSCVNKWNDIVYCNFDVIMGNQNEEFNLEYELQILLKSMKKGFGLGDNWWKELGDCRWSMIEIIWFA